MEENAATIEAEQTGFGGRDLVLIALLLTLAIAIRGWLINHTEVLARDSIGFIRYSLQFESDSWKRVLRDNHQHPGYPLAILAVSLPVRAWSNASEADMMSLSAQLASNLAAVLLVIPMYFLGKILFQRAAGFGAAALFQCLPASAHILSDGLSESLFLLLACSTLCFAALALRGQRLWLFVMCGIFCGLSYLTRPEGAMFLAAALIVLFGEQFSKQHRRPVRQLIACAAASSIAAAVVGSPYVIATHRLTNKPSVHQWMGLGLPEMDSPSPRVLLAPNGPRPLFASIFGINLNLNDPYGKRARQAVIGLAGELAKCFHYATFVPVILGMWWFRRRVWTEPGMLVMLVVCGLLTIALWRLAVQVGYLSDRHLMLIVMCGCFPAAAAIWMLPAKFIRRDVKHQSDDTAVASPSTIRRPLSTVQFATAMLMLCGLIAIGLPKACATLHANRAGHHAAGQWLAVNAVPADAIEDDHCWAHYYAGRVFQERRAISAPAGYSPTRYIVLGRRDREINLTWNNRGPVDEAKLIADGGRVVYHWPPQTMPADAPIVVYAVSPPPARQANGN